MAFNPSQSTFSPLRGTKGQNPHINFPSLIIIRIGGGSYQSHHSNVFHSEQGAQLMPIMNEVFWVFFFFSLLLLFPLNDSPERVH